MFNRFTPKQLAGLCEAALALLFFGGAVTAWVFACLYEPAIYPKELNRADMTATCLGVLGLLAAGVGLLLFMKGMDDLDGGNRMG